MVKHLCNVPSWISRYHMSARWKAMGVGWWEPGKEVTRLVYLEYSIENKRPAHIFLETMYTSKHRKHFQLGIKMRFIFVMEEAVGMYGQDKTKKILDRQLEFSKITWSVRVPGATGVPVLDKRSRLTIADCTVDLKSRVNIKQMSHSLDQLFGMGTTYHLTYIEAYAKEAREVTNGLISHTVREHGCTTTSVDISPSYQPDRALAALNYGLTPTFNLSQSHHGHTPIACAHIETCLDLSTNKDLTNVNIPTHTCTNILMLTNCILMHPTSILVWLSRPQL
jgi:hypothetical protein